MIYNFLRTIHFISNIPKVELVIPEREVMSSLKQCIRHKKLDAASTKMDTKSLKIPTPEAYDKLNLKVGHFDSCPSWQASLPPSVPNTTPHMSN